jgi:hypothetical protein
MTKRLRATNIWKQSLLVISNTLIAIFGTAAVENTIGPIYRASSPQHDLWRLWLLDVVIAGCWGFVLQRFFKGRTALFVWVIPTMIFVPIVFTYALHWNNPVSHFSGRDCAIELRGSPCQDYYLFTVPFIRSLSSSLIALVTFKAESRRQHASRPF